MKYLIVLFLSTSVCASIFGQTLNANSVVFSDPTNGVNGDNTVIYRSDISNDYTRLRIQLGDEETALFEMGYHYYSTSQWTNIFTVDGYGNGFFKGNLSSNGNIVSNRASSGYLALGSDLPGNPVGVYPTLQTNASYIYFSAAGKYSAFLGDAQPRFGLNDAYGLTRVVLHTNGDSYLTGGNLGIGTNAPGTWFPSKTLEISNTRPVLKLNAATSNDLATILFTNTAVNATTHQGEFHINYQYNSANPAQSGIRWSSYPAGEIMTLLANGNLGVGASSPSTRISFGTAIAPRMLSMYDAVGDWYGLGMAGGQLRLQIGNPNARFAFYAGDNTELMTVKGNGYVGVGTPTPDQKLTVKGKIHAEEVIIDLSVPAPDYVFEKSYDLKPLAEVKKYIDENKHLPEVPSAKEMEKDGVKVGEMEMILLKKIEELTLYVIELKKENEKQSEEIQQLKSNK